jgi:hypothetical protein
VRARAARAYRAPPQARLGAGRPGQRRHGARAAPACRPRKKRFLHGRVSLFLPGMKPRC